MKSKPRKAAQALAAAFVLAGLAACGERLSDTSAKAPKPLDPSPSAVVVGQAPAEPTGDPAGTTPVASNTTEIPKSTEIAAKPQEGDNHSYSTLAPVTPQKAGSVAPNEARSQP